MRSGGGLANFALQLVVGAAVGLLGGWLLVRLMRHVSLPNEALYSIRTIAAAGVIYGAATVLHGSGFLAVLLAGILIGDARAPYKREIERFSAGLAGLAEIVVFVVLGLSVPLREVSDPMCSGSASPSPDCSSSWFGPYWSACSCCRSGCAGASGRSCCCRASRAPCPFCLGCSSCRRAWIRRPASTRSSTSSLSSRSSCRAVSCRSSRAVSGSHAHGRSHSLVARLRFSREPRGQSRHVVVAGSPADGPHGRRLDLGEDGWISLVNRAGAARAGARIDPPPGRGHRARAGGAGDAVRGAVRRR
ncbi:MAG: cation:proton antiporter [Galbitalea sp.]